MRNALIWGASGGIGAALATALAAAGWDVAGTARDARRLPPAVAHPIEADVADEAGVRAAVYAAAQALGEVHLSIYAAGDIASVKVADLPASGWARLLDANLTGAYLTAHHSLPLLAPDATLVFVGALHERLRLPGLAAYAAAKAGLEAFAAALAKEERTRRVLVVRPGAVATPLWDKMPVRLPRNALPADAFAQQVLAALDAGTAGVLDL